MSKGQYAPKHLATKETTEEKRIKLLTQNYKDLMKEEQK